ncbi:MAG: hypothetical protein Q9179_006550, partial [Wetmoreana sp. 5 TL-2023]
MSSIQRYTIPASRNARPIDPINSPFFTTRVVKRSTKRTAKSTWKKHPTLGITTQPAWSPTPTYIPPLTIHHATHLPPRLPHQTSLLNPIHPIFRPQNFPSITPNQYALLIPSFRLASRFLTSPLSFAWWVPLILGRTAPHPLIPNATILEAVEATCEKRIEAYLRLHEHRRNVHFAFRDLEGSFGRTHRVPGSDAVKRIVYLDVRFLDFLDDAASSGDADAPQGLRHRFFLALNLVHEIAHILYNPPSSSLSSSSPHNEPYHPLQTCGSLELGAAWESHVFAGGKIQPVNFDPSCRDGL